MDYWVEKIKALLVSRRFQAAIVAVLVVMLQDVLGFDEGTAQNIAQVIMVWILGDSLTNTTSPTLERFKQAA